ncbi:MAG: DUF6058 family natural product biosynthesis protein [Jatrophihabitantaceae bacterium]
MSTDPRRQLAELFRAVNGEHQMTEADDAYVDVHFSPLEQLCGAHTLDVRQVRADMLARRIPLPSYLRSDGAEMIPSCYFEVIDAAGGTSELHAWFRAQWPSQAIADTEWADFLDGHYLCLRQPVPGAMRRKSELVREIKGMLEHPRAEDLDWLTGLHERVDELDSVEQPFTGFDRLRFGGPTSRETCIDDVRRDFPRPAGTGLAPSSF